MYFLIILVPEDKQETSTREAKLQLQNLAPFPLIFLASIFPKLWPPHHFDPYQESSGTTVIQWLQWKLFVPYKYNQNIGLGVKKVRGRKEEPAKGKGRKNSKK